MMSRSIFRISDVYINNIYYVSLQKDEVYLNLVLDFVPETVYRVIRHHSKNKQIMPVLYTKVRMIPL